MGERENIPHSDANKELVDVQVLLRQRLYEGTSLKDVEDRIHQGIYDIVGVNGLKYVIIPTLVRDDSYAGSVIVHELRPSPDTLLERFPIQIFASFGEAQRHKDGYQALSAEADIPAGFRQEGRICMVDDSRAAAGNIKRGLFGSIQGLGYLQVGSVPGVVVVETYVKQILRNKSALWQEKDLQRISKAYVHYYLGIIADANKESQKGKA